MEEIKLTWQQEFELDESLANENMFLATMQAVLGSDGGKEAMHYINDIIDVYEGKYENYDEYVRTTANRGTDNLGLLEFLTALKRGSERKEK